MAFFHWTKYPFVQVGGAFILGNLLSFLFVDLPDDVLNPKTVITFYCFILLSSTVIGVVFFYSLKKSKRMQGGLILLFFTGIGVVHFLMYDPRIDSLNLSHIEESGIEGIQGEITTEPELKNKGLSFTLQCKKYFKNGQWNPCSGFVMVTAATNQTPEYGDDVIVKGTLHKTKAPKHSYEFDYQKFLAYRKIYHTLYSTSAVRNSSSNTIRFFSLKKTAIKTRKLLEDVLKKLLPDTRQYALVAGLLTGKKTALHTEDKKLFADSGTIHVLAVSGMHVALIYQIILFFSLLFKINQRHVVFNTTVLLLIWFYIFITGLQASSCRAAMMISIIVAGKIFHKQPRHINSLFASAFVMLFYNPYYLADIGFVLSFLAVSGILLSGIVPIQENLNPIKKYFLSSGLISTSAQISTFPFSVYLFHQFPVYFLLANLVIVPLAGILLVLSILLLCIFYIPGIREVVLCLIELCCNSMFYVLQGVHLLPLNTLKKISLSGFEMFMLYCIIGTIILWIVTKKKIIVWSILFFSIVMSSSIHYRMIRSFNSDILLISGSQENRQIAVKSNNKILIVSQSKNTSNTPVTDKLITHQFIQEEEHFLVPKNKNCIIYHNGEKIFVFRKPHKKRCLNKVLDQKYDYIIVDYKNKYSYLNRTDSLNLKQYSTIHFTEGESSLCLTYSSL